MDPQRQLHQFQKRADFTFALPLPSILRATLTHLELLLSFDFGTNTFLIENQNSRLKNNLDPQLMKALMSLNKEERLDLYNQNIDQLQRLIQGEELYPCVSIVDIKTSGYVKRSKYSRWQLNKIQYSFNSHFVEIKKESNFEKHYIDLSLYLYRRSKNKDYFAFVLQACDCRVAQYLRSLSIGFKTFQQFEMFSKSIRLSINIRQFEKIKSMFKGDPLTKNCLNSVKNKSLSRVLSGFNGDLDNSAKQQQFFSFQQLPNEPSNPRSQPQSIILNKQDENKQIFAQEILREHPQRADNNLPKQHQYKANQIVWQFNIKQQENKRSREIYEKYYSQKKQREWGIRQIKHKLGQLQERGIKIEQKMNCNIC